MFAIVLVVVVGFLKLDAITEFADHQFDRMQTTVTYVQEKQEKNEEPGLVSTAGAKPIEEWTTINRASFETEIEAPGFAVVDAPVFDTFAQPRNVVLSYSITDEEGFVWVRESPIEDRIVPDGDVYYEAEKLILEAGGSRWVRTR